ncbi:histidine phosphatase family protein [Aeromicrobium sp. IC_218]|uniref:histidine phosphatase family protein n=1 Tax=Aeromicrobium sp. IC_218 TaxID=2545468 RepID=UPI00103D2002|nr:histidine phosphatase family protein [Aeromicrobium sp. IC_218]TCI97670.1 histidine phosphatase family protein [Aeromicrobium sp. IC_218]
MICWLRHGESTWNAAGRMQHRDPRPPLTELGRLQSRTAAEHLRGTAFDALLCSPAVRARQTADVVAEALGLTVQVDDRLVERDHDESAGQVRDRVRALLADHHGELLVVTHGDTIAVAVELLTGSPCEVPGNAQAIVTSREGL